MKRVLIALMCVIGALLFCFFDVAQVRAADPDPQQNVLLVYNRGSSTPTTNCSVLWSTFQHQLAATLSPGQCYSWSEEVYAYPGTGWDQLRFCTPYLVEEDEQTAYLSFRLYGKANAGGIAGISMVGDFFDNYDSGNQSGLIEHEIAVITPPMQVQLTRLSAKGQAIKTYIGGANQIVARAEHEVCFHGAELQEPPPPPEFTCLDGFELLSETVQLSPGSPWTRSLTTDLARFAVRYTFSDTMQGGSLLHYLDMRVNDTQITRRFFSDEMQEWDPVDGWPDTPFSFMVPNTNEPRRADYEPGGFETGPEMELYVAEGYNSINLLSVCVIPVQTSEFCEDGVEALTHSPMYLSAAGGSWWTLDPLEASALGDITHFVVRYRVSHPAWPGENQGSYDPVFGKFMPQIQQNFYYVESPVGYGGITFTLPISSAFALVDEQLYLKFYNRGDAVLLNSVCIIDATDEYLEQLTSENCLLNNPDFITAPNPATDWQTDGTVTHSALIGPNGGVFLPGGTVYQNPVIDVPNVWQMEVRASGGVGNEMTFGTQRPSLTDGGAQLKTETLSPEYKLYRNNIYVTPREWVMVQGEGETAIDYVCLMKRTGILPMPNCDPTMPVWDPPDGTSLLFDITFDKMIYLFKFVGDLIVWGVCALLTVLAAGVNGAVFSIEDILLRIGPLPNPFGGNFWEELQLFISLSLEGLFDYFGKVLFPDLTGFARDLATQTIRWLAWQWRRFGQWLNWLLYDIILWLSNQLGVPPQMIFDTLYAIGYEARMFWLEMQAEILNELGNVLLLLTNMANVLIVLASGVREGVSGNTIAYIGGDFAGIGGFIWDGVAFVNEAIDLTPLSALNVVALGVITYGLMGWTGKKFMGMLEAFS